MDAKSKEHVIQILVLIRKNIVFLALMTILGGGLTFIYNRFLLVPTYEAKTTFLLRSLQSTTAEGNNDETRVATELSSVTLFQKQIRTYIELAQQVSLRTNTETALGLTEEEKGAITGLSIMNTTDSQLVVVAVQGNDLELTRKYASAFGQQFKAFSAEKFGADNLQLVSDADGMTGPVAPRKLRNTAIGALVFLFISLNGLVISYVRRDSIESDTEIEAILGSPIIGAIPCAQQEHAAKRGGKK